MSDDPRAAAVMAVLGHYYCEDCWYSCPQAEDGCCDDERGHECDCGLEKRARDVLAAVDAVGSGAVS